MFDEPVLHKAVSTVAKTNYHKRREPLWIQRYYFIHTLLVNLLSCLVYRETVAQIVRLCKTEPANRANCEIAQSNLESFGMLCLFAYAFLLRVPSEALPVLAGGNGKSVLTQEGEFLVLALTRRKNRSQGSRLERGCWCAECKDTCPLHVLGPFLAKFPVGAPVFCGFTPSSTLKCLRAVMRTLKAPRASEYKTHDFRRGHAKDLQVSGETVGVLLVHLCMRHVRVV